MLAMENRMGGGGGHTSDKCDMLGLAVGAGLQCVVKRMEIQ